MNESELKLQFGEPLQITARLHIKQPTIKEIEKMDDFFSGRRLLIKDRKDKNGFELSIVNLFVRQMHGKISVMSNETEGMRFIVELPQLEVSAN